MVAQNRFHYSWLWRDISSNGYKLASLIFVCFHTISVIPVFIILKKAYNEAAFKRITIQVFMTVVAYRAQHTNRNTWRPFLQIGVFF